MIFKLAWRNACRSAGDYFVYVMTVIILAALLCVAHCVAAVGQRQAGFRQLAFLAGQVFGDAGRGGTIPGGQEILPMPFEIAIGIP